MLVKSKETTIEETRVPTVYLKMMDKTQQNMADSFSDSAFRLSLTQLDCIYMVELVACEIYTSCTVASCELTSCYT